MSLRHRSTISGASDSLLPTRPVRRARDHSLPANAAREPLKRQTFSLAKNDPASAVFSIAASELLAKLRANESGARAGTDPEYLHQMRVTVRRLRAILSLYSALLGRRQQKNLARELRWLAHALGPARDSDVFINDIWPALRDRLGNGPLIESLDAEWLAQRRRNARIAHRALASKRYRRMIVELERRLSEPSWRDHAAAGELAAWNRQARDFARHELARRAERVRDHGRVFGELDAAALHRLRIAIKKSRYVMDALSPLFRQARVKPMLESLSSLQDILGAMNDVAVAAQKIDAVLPKGKCMEAAQLRDQVSTWHALRLKVLKRKLKATWRAHRDAKPFW